MPAPGPSTEPPSETHPTLRRRPTSLDPQELGFTPRGPVPWLAPLLLLGTGLRTLLHALFGAYLDKRELQFALPSETFRQPPDGDELWFDYVADLGDGFNATYSVAYLLAQPHLDVDGRRLPRGEVLVMGGDQVYPTANMDAYKDRFKGPYVAAMPCPPPGQRRPTLYAVPGNHDWYDGLTAFLRLFVRVKTDTIGGWRTEQSRSYFAVELPAGWWLYGIDEQFGTYLDDPQLLYFEKAARKLRDGDQVILAVPAPTWVKAVDEPQAYDTVDYFIRTVVAPAGAHVRVIVSGDMHHYARYSAEHRELITCGGGGAYLAATHKLPDTIMVPPPDTITRKRSPSRAYELAGRYPDADRSRRYGWGVFRRLPWRNPGFATLLGVVHTLLMLTLVSVFAEPVSGAEQRLFSIPQGIMILVTMLGAFFFAKPPHAELKRHVRHAVLGVLHGLVHIAVAAFAAWLWVQLPFTDWRWPLPLVAAAVLYGPVAGLVVGQVVSAYLLVAGSLGVNLNELFAGQGIEHGKAFLRMHIARDGTLTIYPVAVDRISRDWRPTPDSPPHKPWLEPEKPIGVRLAEPDPVVVRP
ncbi:MAG TPA: metallophosphoesterase [Pilimelia sp.]|nr:metallophosphoesterase [Pilimelia sp.]